MLKLVTHHMQSISFFKTLSSINIGKGLLLIKIEPDITGWRKRSLKNDFK
jgi:hypothetical protein